MPFASTISRLTADRPHLWAFLAGCLAVTAGVLLHMPMFWMGRAMAPGGGLHLAGMPMDDGMLWGMALIVAGVVVAGYGLLPRGGPPPAAARGSPDSGRPRSCTRSALISVVERL